MRRCARTTAHWSWLVAALTGRLFRQGVAPGRDRGPGPEAIRSGVDRRPCPAPAVPRPAARASPPGPPPPPPYEPLPPAPYAAKVKDLLTGLPLTDAELAAVTRNRGSLRALIDTWMARPSSARRCSTSSRAPSSRPSSTSPTSTSSCGWTAPTSTAPTSGGCCAQRRGELRPHGAGADRRGPPLHRDGHHHPLHAQRAADGGAGATWTPPPATTPAAPVAGGLLADEQVRRRPDLQVSRRSPTSIRRPAWPRPSPSRRRINPASPNFMKWTFAQPDPARYMPCAEPVVVMGTRRRRAGVRGHVRQPRRLPGRRPTAPSLFTDADWNTWRMVTIRAAAAPARSAPLFWDLPRLRDPGHHRAGAGHAAGRLHDHAGLLRQLAHQPQQQLPGHHQPGADRGPGPQLRRPQHHRAGVARPASTPCTSSRARVCFACHQTLDPMRDFFKQSYSLTYFQQLDRSTGATRCPPRPPSPSTAARR